MELFFKKLKLKIGLNIIFCTCHVLILIKLRKFLVKKIHLLEIFHSPIQYIIKFNFQFFMFEKGYSLKML